MKIKELIKHLDKSEQNNCMVDTMEIGEEFNLDIPYVSQTRLISYWVGNWCCTDTWVGYKLYFFEDEPVAFSSQTGRKSDEIFHWFSLDVAKKVKDYLLSLLIEEEVPLQVKICDLEEDVGDSFKIAFNSQILKKDRILYQGEQVTLLETLTNKPHGISTLCKIQLPNGQIKEVEIEKLDFGYHVTK